MVYKNFNLRLKMLTHDWLNSKSHVTTYFLKYYMKVFCANRLLRKLESSPDSYSPHIRPLIILSLFLFILISFG